MRSLLSSFVVLALLLAALVCVAAPVFAQNSSSAGTASVSEENSPPNAKTPAENTANNSEDETAQFKHSPSVRFLAKITGLSVDGAYWLAVLLNFAIVVVVIAWASKKNLPAVFRNRTASIQKSIEEARRASEDANRRLSEVEARLGRLDQEIAEMRATSEKEAAAEEERIKAASAEDARRMVESAEQEIASATKAAKRDLTAYAADLAVSLAAKQIQVDQPTDQALVRNFGQQLSNDGPARNRN